jgi:ferredoxin
MRKVALELGIECTELNQPTPVTLPAPAMFRKLEIASQALNADVVINLPKLKTHSQMLLTLGVKNLFGTVVAQRKAEWHHMVGADRDTFASLHLDICQAVKPALTILDGVWGMEGYGPSNGNPRRFNLIGASDDTVALDMGICDLLGVPRRSFPLYRAARARGMGVTGLGQIVFKGESPEEFVVRDLKIPALDSLSVIPGNIEWFTRHFLVSRPVYKEDSCMGCGKCEQICPADAIRRRDGKITINYERCIRCYCCQEMCPQDAIRFHRGLMVRLLNWFHR